MTGFYHPNAVDLADLAAICARTATLDALPFAAEVRHNVPIYDVANLDLTDPALLSAWGNVLLTGPGAIVLRGAYADTSAIDAVTTIYSDIIAAEKAAGGSEADHFAAGTNDRVWNAAQKLCLADPAVFAAYFGNPAIAAACTAWLGPHYQMTAQVNLVYPGGAAQSAHRDYHLGFQTAQDCARYPAHVHDLTAALTLQGAIAHCDMPVESGPTRLLPFSQTYGPGYAAFRRADVRAFFEDNAIQLPLAKGDALFFNPALLHAAGANTTADINRMANLLQVSSAFGRAMEALDRAAMCRALYPVLLDQPGDHSAAIAACAEGYSFPTNLDRDPPIGGLAPETQAALMHRALSARMTPKDFAAALATQAARQVP